MIKLRLKILEKVIVVQLMTKQGVLEYCVAILVTDPLFKQIIDKNGLVII